MKKIWTRRKFLQTSLGSSLTISAGAAVRPTPAGAVAPGKMKNRAPGLAAAQHNALRMAMDDIIPAVDGMPAASAVGGVEYAMRVARENPRLGKELDSSLAALDAWSQKQFGRAFTSLSSPQRVEALEALERQSPTAFAALRELIYEAYYTQPQVWKLIGYELHPTNEAGPRMMPFDEAVLAKVRKMPKRYREAS